MHLLVQTGWGRNVNIIEASEKTLKPVVLQVLHIIIYVMQPKINVFKISVAIFCGKSASVCSCVRYKTSIHFPGAGGWGGAEKG